MVSEKDWQEFKDKLKGYTPETRLRILLKLKKQVQDPKILKESDELIKQAFEELDKRQVWKRGGEIFFSARSRLEDEETPRPRQQARNLEEIAGPTPTKPANETPVTYGSSTSSDTYGAKSYFAKYEDKMKAQEPGTVTKKEEPEAPSSLKTDRIAEDIQKYHKKRPEEKERW